MPAILLALAAAGYSAFLFGQAEGRDFWQSPLVLPHLVVASLVAGSAVLLLASIALPDALPAGAHGFPRRAVQWRVHSVLGPFLWLSLLVHGALLLIELTSRHPVQDVAVAARLLTRGELPHALLGRGRADGHGAADDLVDRRRRPRHHVAHRTGRPASPGRSLAVGRSVGQGRPVRAAVVGESMTPSESP